MISDFFRANWQGMVVTVVGGVIVLLIWELLKPRLKQLPKLLAVLAVLAIGGGIIYLFYWLASPLWGDDVLTRGEVIRLLSLTFLLALLFADALGTAYRRRAYKHFQGKQENVDKRIVALEDSRVALEREVSDAATAALTMLDSYRRDIRSKYIREGLLGRLTGESSPITKAERDKDDQLVKEIDELSSKLKLLNGTAISKLLNSKGFPPKTDT